MAPWAVVCGGLKSRTGRFEDTLHLTRTEVVRVDADGTRTVVLRPGIASNIVFALAVGPDGALWAATDDGVSRLHEVDGTLTISNFSFLDGLPVGVSGGPPVRDMAVDAAGVAWLATDGGLFRIVPQGDLVRGVVRDTAGRPVAGADVIILDTPFRAVTDAEGRFALANLPIGFQASCSLMAVWRLVARSPRHSGRWTSSQESRRSRRRCSHGWPQGCRSIRSRVARWYSPCAGARLDIAPGTVQFPAGEPPAIVLTPLPLDSLPLPLQAGFTVGAAADLRPSRHHLDRPRPADLAEHRRAPRWTPGVPPALERGDPHL